MAYTDWSLSFLQKHTSTRPQSCIIRTKISHYIAVQSLATHLDALRIFPLHSESFVLVHRYCYLPIRLFLSNSTLDNKPTLCFMTINHSSCQPYLHRILITISLSSMSGFIRRFQSLCLHGISFSSRQPDIHKGGHSGH